MYLQDPFSVLRSSRESHCSFESSSVQNFKGTASIKMREFDPSHVKETSLIYSLVIN